MIRVIATAVMMLFLVAGQAQKFAHVNSAELLLESPKIKQADEQVKAFQEAKAAEFDQQTAAFKAEYEAFMMKVQSQEYSEVQLQKEQMALAQKEQTLQRLQQELQQQILLKREELYAPVLLEVENAVKAIGKENGYTMIFDVSVGGLLHAVETNDVTAMVRSRLGY